MAGSIVLVGYLNLPSVIQNHPLCPIFPHFENPARKRTLRVHIPSRIKNLGMESFSIVKGGKVLKFISKSIPYNSTLWSIRNSGSYRTYEKKFKFEYEYPNELIELKQEAKGLVRNYKALSVTTAGGRGKRPRFSNR